MVGRFIQSNARFHILTDHPPPPPPPFLERMLIPSKLLNIKADP